jgi:hypothetical protein
MSANSRNLFQFLWYVTVLYTVKEKDGKPDRKPNPLPYGLRNPYRNLKSENSQNYYVQKPQRNCMFMNSASGKIVEDRIKVKERLEESILLIKKTVSLQFTACSIRNSRFSNPALALQRTAGHATYSAADRRSCSFLSS